MPFALYASGLYGFALCSDYPSSLGEVLASGGARVPCAALPADQAGEEALWGAWSLLRLGAFAGHVLGRVVSVCALPALAAPCGRSPSAGCS